MRQAPALPVPAMYMQVCTIWRHEAVDLLVHAQVLDGQLVVQASVRQIAERLPFLSRDTVHRRLRELHRAKVIRPATHAVSRFERPIYLLDLTGTGIGLASPSA